MPDTPVRFGYVLYLSADAGVDPEAALRRHPLVMEGGISVVDESPAAPDGATVTWALVEDVQESLPPPERESLGKFSRGLSVAETDALYLAPRALSLEFAHPREIALPALVRADQLAADLASQLDAIVYDLELRRVVGADRWREGRGGDPAQPAVSVLEHTAVHAYRDGDWLRAVSVGMGKLGLPDLVIEELAAIRLDHLVWIINGVAQHLAEGRRPDRDGWLDLDLHGINHPQVRARLLAEMMANGSGRARLRLHPTTPAEGDADNDLWTIRFQTFDGPDEFARQNAAVAAVFGWHDEIQYVDHDEALQAASIRAREKLPALREAMQRGLQPGEIIQVKLPFAVPGGGNEWMWVEVARWRGESIEGVLTNTPFHIPDLQAGQRIQGRMADVFDYLYIRADGSTEGNETGPIIQRMQTDSERRGAK